MSTRNRISKRGLFAFFTTFLLQIGAAPSAIARGPTDWRTDAAAFRSHQEGTGDTASTTLDSRPTPRITDLNRDPKVDASPNPELEAVRTLVTAKLRALSGADPVMIGGTSTTIKERGSIAGRDAARAYLDQEYRALGFVTSKNTYTYSAGPFKPKANGANFIAEKAGSDPSKVVIISAHLDSVGNAGADDDGSGTIGALAVATLLKDQKFTYTLRILGFDNEEQGLVGSTHYVDSLPAAEKSRIVGLVNLEMISFNSKNDGAYHVIDCDRAESKPLTEAFLASVRASELPLARSAACTDRSDHAEFWKAKIPAIVISQNFFGGDPNPCYHKACDQVGPALNFQYMANLVLATRGAVRELLRPVAAR